MIGNVCGDITGWVFLLITVAVVPNTIQVGPFSSEDVCKKAIEHIYKFPPYGMRLLTPNNSLTTQCFYIGGKK